MSTDTLRAAAQTVAVALLGNKSMLAVAVPQVHARSFGSFLSCAWFFFSHAVLFFLQPLR